MSKLLMRRRKRYRERGVERKEKYNTLANTSLSPLPSASLARFCVSECVCGCDFQRIWYGGWVWLGRVSLAPPAPAQSG